MPDELSYDGFVCYRHQEPDNTWVRQTLVPALDAAGPRGSGDHRHVRLASPITGRLVPRSAFRRSFNRPTALGTPRGRVRVNRPRNRGW